MKSCNAKRHLTRKQRRNMALSWMKRRQFKTRSGDRVNLRLSEPEMRVLVALSKESGLTPSSYLRDLLNETAMMRLPEGKLLVDLFNEVKDDHVPREVLLPWSQYQTERADAA